MKIRYQVEMIGDMAKVIEYRVTQNDWTRTGRDALVYTGIKVASLPAIFADDEVQKLREAGGL